MSFTNDDYLTDIYNYLTEIGTKCNKIITDHDINDNINSLFIDLDNYATSEFDKYKYSSDFSCNIENIFNSISNFDYSFFDENTRKYLENLLGLTSNKFSKLISFYNIKELPNPDSDSLIRFFNYEIKDNFERFFLFNILLPAFCKLRRIIVNRQSNIFQWNFIIIFN